MKILIYGLNYTPELTGIGKYTGEMAASLAAQGHEVRVVTAPPYYPAWRVEAGYHAWAYRQELIDGVAVSRCPLWVPSHPGGAKRLIHLASFALSSLPVLVRQCFWRPDVVWVAAPAFFCAPGAWLAARLCGAKAWLHIQDYEVDAAFDLGLLKGQRLRRIVTALERWMLRRFDVVSTISGRMLGRARDKGVAEPRAVLFPNWVDVSSISPARRGEAIRSALQIPAAAVVALYSGNMGAKQGLELLAQAAALCHQGALDQAGVVFVLCGNGAGKADLMAQCAGLPNVRFMDLLPVEGLGELLGMADIHLLPQRADAADLVMPSKLTGMLASGRPVVATAAPGTELAAVVHGCGVVVAPGDAAAMARAVQDLAADAPRRSALGSAARAYAEMHLGKAAVLQGFEARLTELMCKKS